MACDEVLQVICHKRSVTFSRDMQLSQTPVTDPITPAFDNITGWTIHMTINKSSGTQLLAMTSDGVTPEIVVTDGLNNIFNVTIPEDVLATLPHGKHRTDILFYDDSDVRRATRTFILHLTQEETLAVNP